MAVRTTWKNLLKSGQLDELNRVLNDFDWQAIIRQTILIDRANSAGNKNKIKVPFPILNYGSSRKQSRYEINLQLLGRRESRKASPQIL